MDIDERICRVLEKAISHARAAGKTEDSETRREHLAVLLGSLETAIDFIRIDPVEPTELEIPRKGMDNIIRKFLP